MELFEVEQQSCQQDGICAAVCPMGIIGFEKAAIRPPWRGPMSCACVAAIVWRCAPPAVLLTVRCRSLMSARP